VVSSSELEVKYGLEPGWCTANLGVSQRCWAADEAPSFMGAAAAREAVSAAGLDLEDIDLIINASTTANFEKLVPMAGRCSSSNWTWPIPGFPVLPCKIIF